MSVFGLKNASLESQFCRVDTREPEVTIFGQEDETRKWNLKVRCKNCVVYLFLILLSFKNYFNQYLPTVWSISNKINKIVISDYSDFHKVIIMSDHLYIWLEEKIKYKFVPQFSINSVFVSLIR